MRSGRAGEARSAIVAFQQMRRDRAGAGAFHAWAQAHPFLPVPWDARACRSRASGWAPGPWAAMAGRWAGAAGRCRFHRRDPAGGGPGHQLDRYSGGLRPGPFRRDRAPRAGADGAVRAPLRVHQVRPDLVRRTAAGHATAHRRAGKHPARGRGFAAPSGRGADRPLSNALAGRRRHIAGRLLGTLLALKREGKVGAVGLSNHNLAQLQDAEALGHVDSLQPPFSAIQRSAAADLIPWCEAHGTGVIVYSPMQSGLLSGGFSEARAASLPADDWRSRHAEFRAPALQRNLALAQAFRPVAERHGRRSPPPRWPGP